jgi:hypothetical protein
MKNKITNVVFGGVDMKDHPDYVDVFIESADYDDEPLSDEQLDELNQNSELVHELFLDAIN